jgi:hypothetical protein
MRALTCWRRDRRTCHDLASDLYRQWRDRLGDDHQHVRAIANSLAWALWGMGRYAEARDLSQDTLDRYRRVLGEDHPDTLRTGGHADQDGSDAMRVPVLALARSYNAPVRVVPGVDNGDVRRHRGGDGGQPLAVQPPVLDRPGRPGRDAGDGIPGSLLVATG